MTVGAGTDDNGGDVTITAGQTTHDGSLTGGKVMVTAGIGRDADEGGGTVAIAGGEGTAHTGGAVTILSGSGASSTRA